ncbi:MAG: heme lyase CcmF/NrfE family subunit [Chromatiales bacterium]|nr:heme lyase CcmF/NrfE family subunit [Chromatiales bacterium]
MLPELGNFALIAAFVVAVVQTILPLLGAHRGARGWMAVAAPAAQAQFGLLAVAFVCLTAAFLAEDFSVTYVAKNSNEALPVIYKISAVWGAHEGSLLLWALILAGWSTAVSVASGSLPSAFKARVLGVLGFVSSGFLSFMLFTSNPFDRMLPPPPHGGDLNPLLQDIGLVIHPPMLYMGYVGLAVPFAFAIAALLDGRLDAAWTRWTRPWTIVAWTFLTAGITLGSWWAYYELGWGGWWFWDPVENASFMPWLVATALIHSLAVTEKRGAFKAWTVLLAISGFSLSLLGTFLVRSGVLVSVHAFASDPERGVFILAFLVIVVGGALTLYAFRATDVSGGGQFAPMSRETLLLVNNVLLVVACAAVLFGTMYPLIADVLQQPKVSVGKPFFEWVFVPLTLPLAVVLGIGPLTRWKHDRVTEVARRLGALAIGALGFGVFATALVYPPGSLLVVVALAIAAWVILTSLKSVQARLANKSNKLRALWNLPREFVGMVLAHIGLGIFIIGATLASTYSLEKDVALKPGESHQLGGYRFEFRGVTSSPGVNYQAERGEIVVYDGAQQIRVLHPEKRFYPIQAQPMTEADIDAGVTRDVYVALGERLGNDAWSVRLYVKPFIRWIWFGPVFMVLGGILAATDRRYRLTPHARRPVASAPPSRTNIAAAAGAGD